MKASLLAVLAAFLLAGPAMAADETAPTEVVPETDPFSNVSELFGAMFPVEPLSAEAEARLPAARELADYLVPAGSYATLLKDTYERMSEGLGGLIKSSPQAAVAKLTGLNEDDLADYDEAALAEIVAVLDPAYAERTEISMRTVFTGMSGVMVKAEPAFRDGYAAAVAEHFTAEQIVDLKAFFETPTGTYFASRTLRLTSDPRVMAKMSDIFPIIMQEMPAIMADVEAQLAELPPERYFDMLDSGEQAQVSKLLGQPVEELAAASAYARAEAERAELEDSPIGDDEAGRQHTD